MTPPKQSKPKPALRIVPPALGAVVKSLEEAGDHEAAGRLASVSSPEALANVKVERREFHDRKKHAVAARTGVLFVNNKALALDEQRERLTQIVGLSKRTTTPNVFTDKWVELTVSGVKVVGVCVDVLRYNDSVVKQFVESSKNRVGYKLFVK